MRHALVLLVLATVSATLAATARADGDPASDYLLTEQTFLPYDAKIPRAQQQKLASLVAAANRAGYTIRVALISSANDLGSVPSLWRKPRTYARFLGAELQFVYANRLLVVMPNGLGFNRPHHSPAAEYAILGGIRVGSGGSGLASAAQTAVRRLAAAAGVRVRPKPAATHTTRNAHDRVVILLVAIAVLAVLVLLRMALRRPRRQRSRT
jgi:hypothetical protein